MARFAAVRSRDEVKQANYLRLIWECQEKNLEDFNARCAATTAITGFSAARAALREDGEMSRRSGSAA
jgi:hypothetical protein